MAAARLLKDYKGKTISIKEAELFQTAL